MSVKERLEDYLKGYQSQYNFVGEDKIEHTLHNDIKSLLEENENLKRQLEYLRSGEYLNQLKYERNLLESIVQDYEIPKEDKEFIDMTHRNTELLEQINKAIEYMNGEEFFMKMNSNSIQPPADKYVCQDYFEAKNKLVNILGGDVDDE